MEKKKEKKRIIEYETMQTIRNIVLESVSDDKRYDFLIKILKGEANLTQIGINTNNKIESKHAKKFWI